MSKIALITGIAGQDGSYLSELLLKKGYEVHGFVKKTFNSRKKIHIWRIKHIIKKIKLHKVDIDNLDKIYRLINKIKPDEVYHLAAQANDAHSFKDELSTFNVNLNFTHKILFSIYRINKKARFFFAGSSEIFSAENKKKINEKTQFNPSSAYGISKLSSFYLVKNYRENYNYHASTGILFNHESPRKNNNFVLKKISETAVKIKFGFKKKIRLGNIKAKRDWGHAKDYVKAMWLITQYKKPGDYIIGSGKLISVEEYAKKTFKYLNLDYKKYIKIDKKLFRNKDNAAKIANITKIRSKLKWKPEYNLTKLIKEMIESELKKNKKNEQT